jgi:hypothetical protein
VLRHVTEGLFCLAGWFSENKKLATTDRTESQQRPQQSRLPGTIGSENPNEFPFLNFRRDPVQDLPPPKTNPKITD